MTRPPVSELRETIAKFERKCDAIAKVASYTSDALNASRKRLAESEVKARALQVALAECHAMLVQINNEQSGGRRSIEALLDKLDVL